MWTCASTYKYNLYFSENSLGNDNLEQQAQALYKSWFVDFEPFKGGKFVDSELGKIPEGWRVGKLSDIAEITMGQSPAGNSYNENKDGMIFYQGRGEFGKRFPAPRLYTTEPKRIAESNSVLLSVRAPVGDINIASEECCIGRGLASIKSNSQNNSFVFYSMIALKPVLEKYNAEGTVFGSINKNALNELCVLIPQKEIISKYENIAKFFDTDILKRSEENRKLSALRDSLLPRLMSGELKTKEL
jgi:type I restriction enzyme S subunit